VDRGHMILKMYNVIENQSLSLAHRVVAHYLLLCRYLAQTNILNMVPHVQNAVKNARSLLVWKPLISDANNTLGLLETTENSLGGGKGSGAGDSFFG
jgi:hypothetical protein